MSTHGSETIATDIPGSGCDFGLIDNLLISDTSKGFKYIGIAA